MNNKEMLIRQWKAEEEIAYIHGWDFFSHCRPVRRAG